MRPWPLPVWALALGACSDLFVPDVPDTRAPPDALTPDATDDTLDPDLPDIGGVACERDEDCASLGACCLDVVCQAGVCMPSYVQQCCVEPGPCAVSSLFRAGACVATCEARGCVESLHLGATGCDTTLWALSLTPEGLGDVFMSDGGATDRVTWHLSPLRTFDGAPALRAGDVQCATYHTGADPLTCAPNGESAAVQIAFESPTIDLPSDAAALVELWVYADLPDQGGLTTPLDGLELEIIAPGSGSLVVWSTRMTPIPVRAWTPVLVDLTLFAGRPLSFKLRFDTLDGRDNDHEGVSLGRVRVRTACEADRTASDRGVCEVAWPTAVRGLEDTLPMYGPPDPSTRCTPCTVAEACPRADTCDVAACVAGRCDVERVITHECCTADARWAGDGSFESPLPAPTDLSPDGWLVAGAWSVSSLRSFAGERALHFGQPDGSGLAPPGEAAEGTLMSPIIAVPEDAPRWRFMLWLSTEWDLAPSGENPAGVDLLEVLVLLDSPAVVTPTVVWDSRSVGGTTLGAWVEVEIDLTPWRGRAVRLGWRFATGDADANAAEGVYLDRAVVFRACPGCDAAEVEAGDPACDARR